MKYSLKSAILNIVVIVIVKEVTRYIIKKAEFKLDKVFKSKGKIL